MATAHQSGPRFEGDTTYPLTAEERRQFLSQFSFDTEYERDMPDKWRSLGWSEEMIAQSLASHKMTPEEQKKVFESIEKMLDTPYGCRLARESIASGEKYTLGKSQDDNVTGSATPFSSDISINFKTCDTPEQIGATLFHEMRHTQQNSTWNKIRGFRRTDAPTQALSAQAELELDIGSDTAYYAEFKSEYDKFLAYAQNPNGQDVPEGGIEFKPKEGLSSEQLTSAQKSYAFQMAGERMEERFQNTFNTDLEDWRPGEHILSRDIATMQETYKSQDESNESEASAQQSCFDYLRSVKDNNNKKPPQKYTAENLRGLDEYINKEASTLGEDAPLVKEMRSVLKKMQGNHPKLSNQEMGTLSFLLARQYPNLNEHSRNKLAIEAGMAYDSNLSETRKANDPVRDQLMTETQRMTGNPYLTPTYAQEQDIKAGKEVELAQNNEQTTESTQEHGSANTALAGVGKDITAEQVEQATSQTQTETTRDV